MKEVVRVQLADRDDVGIVIEKTDKYVTVDFGTFKVSAPADTFTLVGDA